MAVWDDVIKVAAANGIWALLFVALLIFELQDSRKREAKYQQIIDNLTKDLETLEDVRDDVKEIKEYTVKGERRKRREVMV